MTLKLGMSDGLETWYVSLDTRVQDYTNDDIWLTSTFLWHYGKMLEHKTSLKILKIFVSKLVYKVVSISA